MDTHFKGPRGGVGNSAAVTQVIASAIVGTTADGTVEVLRTDGASSDNPLRVRIFGHNPTAFDGDTPTFTLKQTDLDGTNETDVADLADFSAGKMSLEFILTEDKIFLLEFESAADGGNADFTDGVSLNADATYESAAANFVAGDVGLSITGTNIPAGTTILSVTDDDTIELSANATGAGTGLSFTIEARDPGTAGEGHYCIELAGPGQLA